MAHALHPNYMVSLLACLDLLLPIIQTAASYGDLDLISYRTDMKKTISLNYMEDLSSNKMQTNAMPPMLSHPSFSER